MESGWHELFEGHRGALPARPVRFSVYLEELALERELAQRVVVVPEGKRGRGCVCDVVELSEAARRASRERPFAAVETVTRVRVQMTSPAGRFLDLLI